MAEVGILIIVLLVFVNSSGQGDNAAMLPENFVLEDGTFCPQPSLYYTTLNFIHCIRLGKDGKAFGTSKNVFSTGNYRSQFQYKIRPLALDARNETLYWVDTYRKQINQLKYNQTNHRKVIDGVVGDVRNMAIDWVSQFIYWNDDSNQRIVVASVREGYMKTVVASNISRSRGLAVDPIKGFLFWSDSGSSHKIERSLLDGKERTVISDKDVYYPGDISLDIRNSRLYFIDNSRICSVNYNGGQPRCILLKSIANRLSPYSLTYYELNKTVYITDLIDHNLKSYDLARNISNKRVTQRFISLSAFYEQVEIFDTASQPAGSSPCLRTPKPCSHFCFKQNDTSFRCDCPDGMQLNPDSTTCRQLDVDYRLYVADAHAGKLYHITKFINQTKTTTFAAPNPSTRTSFPIAVAFDAQEDRVYWSDWDAKSIFRMHSNGTGYERILTVTLVEGMAFDHVSRLLFWTSSDFWRICVAQPDGSNMVMVVNHDLDTPRDIVLYPEKGLMFVTQWLRNPKVEQMNMDGSGRRIIFNQYSNHKVRWPNAVTIDKVEDKLYCIDASYKKLLIYDLKTRKAKVIFTQSYGQKPPKSLLTSNYRTGNGIGKPFGLTLHKEYLYWSDWDSASVYRLNKRYGNWKELVFAGFVLPEDLHAAGSRGDDYKMIHIVAYPSHPCTLGCSNNILRSIQFQNCPSGYQLVKENIDCYKVSPNPDQVLGLRCECIDWASCTHRLEHQVPCKGNNFSVVHFGIRQCTKTVRPGYCPSSPSPSCGNKARCIADQDCSASLKCCKTSCGSVCIAPNYDLPNIYPCQLEYKACNICVSLPNNTHRCLCPRRTYLGPDGKTCETEREICHRFGGCVHNGTCKVKNGIPSCDCPLGFNGKHCEVPPRCFLRPCKNGGTCIEEVNGYKCICLSHNTGKDCLLTRKCTINKCQNNGTCYIGAKDTSYCNCTNGFGGINCTKRLDCNGDICHNNGSCSYHGSHYRCDCQLGFKGPHCKSLSYCYSNPCRNNATCIEKQNGFLCQCSGEYSGQYCDEFLNCSSVRCHNYGTCINHGSGNYCQCLPMYTGKLCENRLYCNETACKNGGTCIEIQNGFNCTCPKGYTGTFCESRSLCSQVNCLNNGRCIENGTNYRCLCPPQYSGRHCKVFLSCFRNQCKNNGTCLEKEIGYECVCGKRYSGRHCEYKIDNCSNHRCENNANCIDDDLSYHCVCRKGFSGRYCENSVCFPELCQNGGRCLQSSPDRCLCTAYYIGNHCTLFAGNNILVVILKSKQGMVITATRFKDVFAKLYSMYCQYGQDSGNCPKLGKINKRIKRNVDVRNDFTAKDIVILTGFPKTREDGSQEFQYTVFVPQNISGSQSRTLLPLQTIESGFNSLKNFTEKEIGVEIVSQYRLQQKQQKVEKQRSGVSTGTIAGIIVTMVILLVVTAVLFVLYKRRKSKGKDRASTIQYVNQAFEPDVRAESKLNDIGNPLYDTNSFTLKT